jgi:hypothetical protein
MNTNVLRPILLLISIALWVTSLFLPAVWQGTAPLDFGNSGFFTLAIGWAEVASGQKVGPFVALAWFANPLIVMALILDSLGSKVESKGALILASIAALLCVGYILFGQSVVLDESGNANPVQTFTPGSAFWAASSLTTLIRTLLPPNSRL